MTDPTPDDLARAWADTHWDDYATQPARGPLADAFRAGYAAALERAAGVCREVRAVRATPNEAMWLAYCQACDGIEHFIRKLAG